MRTKFAGAFVLAIVGTWLTAGGFSTAAEEPKESTKATAARGERQGVEIGTKLEESEAKGQAEEPHYGYVGDLGVFEANGKDQSGEHSMAVFVVHANPSQTDVELGRTHLKYVGAKRIGNVEGWVFSTDWDGSKYPSKVFLSAEPVYFGGGVTKFIAADYRESTGWTWKMLPLRRMEMTQKTTSEKSTEKSTAQKESK